MSDMSAPAAMAAPPFPRFWPHFAVPAILVPVVWTILEGLAGPDGVIAFYFISIGAIPLCFVLVLRPGWRLARRTASRLLAGLIALLMLPSAAILLWGVYCFVWLAILAVTMDF